MKNTKDEASNSTSTDDSISQLSSAQDSLTVSSTSDSNITDATEFLKGVVLDKNASNDKGSILSDDHYHSVSEKSEVTPCHILLRRKGGKTTNHRTKEKKRKISSCVNSISAPKKKKLREIETQSISGLKSRKYVEEFCKKKSKSSQTTDDKSFSKKYPSGIDRETKQAIKASLETYDKECRTRRIILGANTRTNDQPSSLTMRSLRRSKFTYNEFLRLWKECEENFGSSTEEIENGKLVRDANHANRNGTASTLPTTVLKSSFSSYQTSAQYGRILFPAMQKIIEISKIEEKEKFIDVGHGIGNAALQAAFTVGCEARGIEIVPDRFRISEQFREALFECVDLVAYEEKGKRRKVGKVSFREGCLTDLQQRDFITECDVMLVNNAHEIFGSRSTDVKVGLPTLDTHVASLFAMMKPGSRMITLHPIICLGRSLTEENEKRRKTGLEESLDASFFLVDKISIGVNAVTWSYTKEIFVYLYTRVHQSNSNGTAVFICGNKRCNFIGSPTAAIAEDGTLQENCVYCGAKRSIRTRQSR